MNSDIGYRLYSSLPLFFSLATIYSHSYSSLSLFSCDYLYPFLLRLFIANDWGQEASALNKNCIHPTAPPTINVTAPPNMTIMYY